MLSHLITSDLYGKSMPTLVTIRIKSPLHNCKPEMGEPSDPSLVQQVITLTQPLPGKPLSQLCLALLGCFVFSSV